MARALDASAMLALVLNEPGAAVVDTALAMSSDQCCFCIATARALGADLLTADHGEFDSVVALGLCSVTFIR